ncbi:hypothetical protein [Pseudonocardia sp. C8]|nr:hypothetical protein [Pseudonocardia sp. C8]
MDTAVLISLVMAGVADILATIALVVALRRRRVPRHRSSIDLKRH